MECLQCDTMACHTSWRQKTEEQGFRLAETSGHRNKRAELNTKFPWMQSHWQQVFKRHMTWYKVLDSEIPESPVQVPPVFLIVFIFNTYSNHFSESASCAAGDFLCPSPRATSGRLSSTNRENWLTNTIYCLFFLHPAFCFFAHKPAGHLKDDLLSFQRSDCTCLLN